MAKTQERALAKELYLKGKLQKEIAQLVGVQEKTISGWAERYGWKQQRNARINSEKSRCDNLKELIGSLVDQRLELVKELDRLKAENAPSDVIADKNREAVSLADEVSKYNKALEQLDKEHRVSLTVYLEVMDDIFQAIQEHSSKLYLQLLDFQEDHLSTISLKLK